MFYVLWILCKEKVFSILYFIFLINEVKEFRKNINVLRRWSTTASKVDGKRSPLKLFLVNIPYRNSITLEPDLFFSLKIAYILNWSNSRRNHRSWIYLPVRRFCFFNFWDVAIFLICKKLLSESHPACVAGSKRHIGNPKLMRV